MGTKADGAAREKSMEERMAECMAHATAREEHALLRPFEGFWKATVKMWWDPEGEPQVSTGMMKNRLVLNGLFLEQEYGDDAGQFSGRGFWGYNTVDRRWEGFWIDSMISMMQTEHGVYDAAGRTWTMTGEMTDPGNGKRLTKRSVITVLGPDHHTMEMFFTTEKGEKKGMEIEYRRA
jgi:hypothetical protein